MRILSCSETGLVRKNNEDAYLILQDRGLLAVADGMGGHLAGEVAARMALAQLAKSAAELDTLERDTLGDWLQRSLTEANRVVYASSLASPERRGMGTTLTALLILRQEVLIGHVGDSRAYLWRGGELIALTDDHSLVGELLRLGQISPEEAEKHPKRNMIMRAVGAAEEIEIDLRKVETQARDVFFLCTDGFSDVVKAEEVRDELGAERSWEGHLEALRRLVLERGAPDNFTLLCCVLD
ncbi:phosphoprotein phosphatase [Acididesulfobacillus acetoxydans]|uniref:Phosphoprotein phosphatase n=1 Tax=Acididesulfobacillus acetoxydans TaxID=1561005 RepID=A0A8S0Y458_9FIRM|nr:Stp1/IreP family PP2C-type Ser/Thr phosphatase [Acididesulfobacillus acetoxydans]CAA7602755.1 phosphoprotein phosphatase [Acididesulfobacillus acetoxydans]CEJ06388.1 Protein phosphatase PrpC [Acididesulfobacillus acetoxydans]